MDEVKGMSISLTEAIKDNNLQDVVSNLSEVTIDSLLESGTLKDIPVIGVLVGINRYRLTFQEKLFTKKLINFLYQLRDTSSEERKEQIDKIDRDANYKTKVGEKLLYLIERSDDSEKAGILGVLFQGYLRKELSYNEFLTASKSVEMMDLSDVKWLVENSNCNKFEIEEAGSLISTAFVTAVFLSPQLKYDPKDVATLKVHISELGKKVRKLLANSV